MAQSDYRGVPSHDSTRQSKSLTPRQHQVKQPFISLSGLVHLVGGIRDFRFRKLVPILPIGCKLCPESGALARAKGLNLTGSGACGLFHEYVGSQVSHPVPMNCNKKKAKTACSSLLLPSKPKGMQKNSSIYNTDCSLCSRVLQNMNRLLNVILWLLMLLI